MDFTYSSEIEKDVSLSASTSKFWPCICDYKVGNIESGREISFMVFIRNQVLLRKKKISLNLLVLKSLTKNVFFYLLLAVIIITNFTYYLGNERTNVYSFFDDLSAFFYELPKVSMCWSVCLLIDWLIDILTTVVCIVCRSVGWINKVPIVLLFWMWICTMMKLLRSKFKTLPKKNREMICPLVFRDVTAIFIPFFTNIRY